ncbi:division plane positioning ATPase MipZ [Komagataeibacter rhaeticus]|nr:division plane positioning ATPase MipZ [Komagataeibacter rhaeticus]
MKISAKSPKNTDLDLSDSVIVEHRKQRATKDNSPIHWHIIAPHLNPRTGKALNNRNSYKRNEKLSRLSEIRTGQKIQTGKHNRAVFHQLMDEGKTAQADAIKHTTVSDLPHASYGENTRRKAENAGISLPKAKAEISDIWKQSDGLKAFIAGLDNAGYVFKSGIRRDTFIIEKTGN